MECELCSQRSTFECCEDGLLFCDEHSKSHALKRKHFLKGIQLGSLHHLCRVHRKEKLDHYCIQCATAICSLCLRLNHNHHKVLDSEEQLDFLRKQSSILFKQIDAHLEKERNCLEEVESLDESAIEITRADIKQHFEYLQEMLEREKMELLRTVDLFEDQQTMKRGELENQYWEKKSDLDGKKEFLQDTLKKRNLLEGFELFRSLSKELSTFKSIVPPNASERCLYFTADEANDNVKDLVGELRLQTALNPTQSVGITLEILQAEQKNMTQLPNSTTMSSLLPQDAAFNFDSSTGLSMPSMIGTQSFHFAEPNSFSSNRQTGLGSFGIPSSSVPSLQFAYLM
jgi:hypothetical protein